MSDPPPILYFVMLGLCACNTAVGVHAEWPILIALGVLGVVINAMVVATHLTGRGGHRPMSRATITYDPDLIPEHTCPACGRDYRLTRWERVKRMLTRAIEAGKDTP